MRYISLDCLYFKIAHDGLNHMTDLCRLILLGIVLSFEDLACFISLFGV